MIMVRACNDTPFLVGTKLTSRRPPAPEMSVVVRGAFTLVPGGTVAVADAQGHLSGDVHRPDDDERLGDLVHASDFADFKPRADVMLQGSCHTPSGLPQVSCPVELSVGSWSKRLGVVGPRLWDDNQTHKPTTSPEPFVFMPLTYGNAFGGPGFADNPVGRGVGTRGLPTVEHSNRLIRNRADRPLPASFAPVSPGWPARARLLGKDYGKRYRAERWPYYSADFDWGYFNAAPPDQQLEGYLRGDETVTLLNLHPAFEHLSTRLPGLRVRVFAMGHDGRFAELAMRLDTLLVEPEHNRLLLTWRGLCDVEREDFSDQRALVIGSEPLAERPRPPAVYRALLEAHDKDPLGLAASLGLDELPRSDADGGRLPPVLGALLAARHAAALDEANAALAEIEKRAPEEHPVDLAAELKKSTTAEAPPPRVVIPLRPGVGANVPVKARMRQLIDKLDLLEKQPGLTDEQKAKLDELRALVDRAELADADPAFERTGPVPADEPGPGRDLSEQDLSGRDLRGRDLSGATLLGTNLTEANLQGANLRGANLKGAILYAADVRETDFSDADLTLANLSGADARGAVFQGARLRDTAFVKARLDGADLQRARGEYVNFERASLAGADARGAQLEGSDLSESNVEGARFGGANLRLADFTRARAKGIGLERAKLGRATLLDADLTGAQGQEVRANASDWTGTNLDGADLTLGSFHDAFFIGAYGSRLVARAADFRRARFDGCRLDGAALDGANFFEADFKHAVLRATSFRRASLFEAKFYRASGDDCDFAGANLLRCTLLEGQ